LKTGNYSKSANAVDKTHREFQTTVWATADKLRGNLNATEYEHVSLSLPSLTVVRRSAELPE
jgi:type I restriction-modification system DNA methylase subunit